MIWFWPLETIVCHLCAQLKDTALRVPGQFFVVLDVWFINQWIHLMQLCVASDMALCCVIYFPCTKSHCPGLPVRPYKCVCVFLKQLFFLFFILSHLVPVFSHLLDITVCLLCLQNFPSRAVLSSKLCYPTLLFCSLLIPRWLIHSARQ